MHELKNQINKILNEIKINRVKIIIQDSEFTNDDLYVRGEYKVLLEIKEQIDKHFPICDTNFVHGCYIPFPNGMIMCEDWAEDLVSDAWCTNDPCKSPKVLEICIPEKDTKDIIEEVFKKNLNK